jgi:hypothetical protein
VLDGGLAAPGGAKSTGVIMPPAALLVDRPKYRSSICGEILGSDAEGSASGPVVVLVAAELAAGSAGADGADGADGAEGMSGMDEGGSGGGRGITIRLVAGWAAGRKRKATGPTTGK